MCQFATLVLAESLLFLITFNLLNAYKIDNIFQQINFFSLFLILEKKCQKGFHTKKVLIKCG